jgi:tellurite resistance protein TerC
MPLFRYLKYGLALILVFVGMKMLLSGYYKMDTFLALTIVVSVLAVSMLLSVVYKNKK